MKLKKVCSSILLAVAILSENVTTMLSENEAVFFGNFVHICDIISDSNKKCDESI